MAFGLLGKYVLKVCVPYVLISLAILTVILFVQQLNRFAEVLGAATAPAALAAEVLISLSPNVLIFTLPMSVMVGVATGYSKLAHDSEATAMRAAGVGTLRIIAPAAMLGAVGAALTLYIGFGVAPLAAQNLRDLALRAALHSLESPVAPRSFYTGMPGKVIYIREGNRESGQWEGVFIHWHEPDGHTRLVTAARGRLDFSQEQTELVLEDAVVTTLPPDRDGAKASDVVVERSGQLRVRDDQLNINRGALMRRVGERERELDEMGWEELRRAARGASDKKRGREAGIAFHRRLTLCLSPVVFALLGALLGLRVGRGGRSHGVLLSLAVMLAYYLASVAGEQLARAEVVPPLFGAWPALCLAAAGGVFLLAWSGRSFGPVINLRVRAAKAQRGPSLVVFEGRRSLKLLGLLDRSVIGSLARNFLLTFCFLILIFLTFTLFELLRFVVTGRAAAQMIASYFLFLLPFVSVTVTPVSTLLAVLITFALLVRRSEAVAWWASGQSIFRLILPCLFFAAAVGCGLWAVQERVMPSANRRQNALRASIRGGVARLDMSSGRAWVTGVGSRNIYSFDLKETGEIEGLYIFEFAREGAHLTRIITAGAAKAVNARNDVLTLEEIKAIELGGDSVSLHAPATLELRAEDLGQAGSEIGRPSEVSSTILSAYIKSLKARGADTKALSTALERRRADPFAPIVMVLIGVPLALASGRKGAVTAICLAVGSGLAFWGLSAGLQQMGAGGYLPPPVAAWSPLLIFSALGLYLLSRVKT